MNASQDDTSLLRGRGHWKFMYLYWSSIVTLNRKCHLSVLSVLWLKFMRFSQSRMTFFSFYIIISTLQSCEFCVHSCVTWYEETRAEQALLRFFYDKIISNFVKTCKYHPKSFYILFLQYSPRFQIQSNRYDIKKFKFRDTNFQLTAVARLKKMSIGNKFWRITINSMSILMCRPETKHLARS